MFISTDLFQENFASNEETAETNRIKAVLNNVSDTNESAVAIKLPKRNPFYIGPLKNARIDDDSIAKYKTVEPLRIQRDQMCGLQPFSFVDASKDINPTGTN